MIVPSHVLYDWSRGKINRINLCMVQSSAQSINDDCRMFESYTRISMYGMAMHEMCVWSRVDSTVSKAYYDVSRIQTNNCINYWHA